MTNYNWYKIREYLATQVMGWEIYGDSIFGPDNKQPPGGDVGPIGEYKMEVGDWRPDEDLNQTFKLGNELGDLSVGFSTYQNEWLSKISTRFPGGYTKGQGRYKCSPAKAICLAVLKASGAYLSEYEVGDE